MYGLLRKLLATTPRRKATHTTATKHKLVVITDPAIIETCAFSGLDPLLALQTIAAHLVDENALLLVRMSYYSREGEELKQKPYTDSQISFLNFFIKQTKPATSSHLDQDCRELRLEMDELKIHRDLTKISKAFICLNHHTSLISPFVALKLRFNLVNDDIDALAENVAELLSIDFTEYNASIAALKTKLKLFDKIKSLEDQLTHLLFADVDDGEEELITDYQRPLDRLTSLMSVTLHTLLLDSSVSAEQNSRCEELNELINKANMASPTDTPLFYEINRLVEASSTEFESISSKYTAILTEAAKTALTVSALEIAPLLEQELNELNCALKRRQQIKAQLTTEDTVVIAEDFDGLPDAPTFSA